MAVHEEEPPSGDPGGRCELRVHGVGSHGPLSAIGAPTVVPESGDALQRDALITVYKPPILPQHDVELFNWSQITRNRYKISWWFGFPLTLVSMAGFMVPSHDADKHDGRPGEHSKGHSFFVSVAAIVLTVGYLLWSFALVEALPLKLNAYAIRGLEIFVASLFVVIIARRIVWEESRPIGASPTAHPLPRLLWLVQLVIVLAVALTVLVGRPAERTFKRDAGWLAPQTWVSTCWSVAPEKVPADVPSVHQPCSTRRDVPNRFDLLSVYVIVSSAFAATALIGGALSATRRRRGKSTFRSIAAISAAVLLTNVVFGGLRTGLSWFTVYVDRRMIPALTPQCYTAEACARKVDATRSLVPYNSHTWNVFDMVPVGVVWIGIAGGLIAMISHVWKRVRDRRTPPLARSRKAAESVHDFVAEAPWGLRWWALAVALALVVVSIASVAIGWNRSHVPWLTPLVLGAIDLSALLVPLSLLAIVVFAPIRKAVSIVADVVGYWPMRYSALGGRSYTDEVCRQLEARVQSTKPPIVLVGHSQGSVLCYTALQRNRLLVTNEKQTHGPVSLATCGTPLRSLYIAFFPAYFSVSDLSDLRNALGGRWINMWRSTDPIGSRLFDDTTGVDRFIKDNGDWRGKLNRHSNYWSEQEQAEAIDELLDEHARRAVPSDIGTSTGE